MSLDYDELIKRGLLKNRDEEEDFLVSPRLSIHLRSPNEKDVDALQLLFLDPSLRESSGEHNNEEHGRSKESTRQWIQEARKSSETFVVIKNKIVIGIAVFTDWKLDTGKVTAGVQILPAYYRQGYGTEAMRLLCEHGFTNLELPIIEFQTCSTNYKVKAMVDKFRIREVDEPEPGQSRYAIAIKEYFKRREEF